MEYCHQYASELVIGHEGLGDELTDGGCWQGMISVDNQQVSNVIKAFFFLARNNFPVANSNNNPFARLSPS